VSRIKEAMDKGQVRVALEALGTVWLKHQLPLTKLFATCLAEETQRAVFFATDKAELMRACPAACQEDLRDIHQLRSERSKQEVAYAKLTSSKKPLIKHFCKTVQDYLCVSGAGIAAAQEAASRESEVAKLQVGCPELPALVLAFERFIENPIDLAEVEKYLGESKELAAVAEFLARCEGSDVKDEQTALLVQKAAQLCGDCSLVGCLGALAEVYSPQSPLQACSSEFLDALVVSCARLDRVFCRGQWERSRLCTVISLRKQRR
jgi:hypothetical protein